MENIISLEFKNYRGIEGFGVPLRSIDERIAPVKKMANELGLDNGPHTKLAFDVDSFLAREKRKRFRINIAGLTAALTADQGINANEYSCLAVPSFLAGILPCYVDARKHPEGTFFPLRCKTLNYQGSIKHRTW